MGAALETVRAALTGDVDAMAQFDVTPDQLPPFEGRSEAARIRTRQALLIRAIAAIGDQLVGDSR